VSSHWRACEPPLVGWRTSDQDGWGLRSNLICRGIFEDFHAGSKGNLYSKIATPRIDLGRAGFVEGTPFGLISLVLPQVIEMTVRNFSQSIKAGIAIHIERPFAQFARGGARDSAM